MYIAKYLIVTLLLIRCFDLPAKTEKSAGMNAQTDDEKMCLHDALKAPWTINQSDCGADIDLIKRLIKSGCNVDAKNEHGDTPLHKAIFYRYTNVANLLIQAGANINAQDDRGWTPLHAAVFTSRYTTLDALIKAGANLNIKDDAIDLIHLSTSNRRGLTPLAFAALYNRPISLRHLLNAGADISVKDYEGMTPLHLGSAANSPRVVELLLRAGADRDAKNQKGLTPLEVVGQYDNPYRTDNHAQVSDHEEVKALLKEWDRKDPKNAPAWHWSNPKPLEEQEPDGAVWIFQYTSRSWEEPESAEDAQKNDAL